MRKKVLLLFPMADGQTGPAIKHAFEKLGHEVMAVDAKIQPKASYCVACRFKPDLVFCSRTEALTKEVAQIRLNLQDAKICMWNVDTRPGIKRWAHLFPLVKLCDYHFISDTETIPLWRHINPNTFWLPQGLQNEVYDRPKNITKEDKARYSCDVSFAGGLSGSAHANRNQYLEAIRQTGVDLKLWGCGRNPRVYNEEHNKMVSLSKINLCCSAYPENGKCTSVRNYKVLGAGGFALELHRKGIYDLFPENVIRCYTTPEDLVEKVRHLLSHDQERRMVAEAGYDWVHNNATYMHRIKMALDYMEA